MTHVTSSNLRDLLAGTHISPRAPAPPPPPASSPPRYGERGGGVAWRPTESRHYRDGGAFPEIDVVQLLEGMGWGRAIGDPNVAGREKGASRLATPASLDCSFEELQTRASRAMLRLPDPPIVAGGGEASRASRLATPPPPNRKTSEYASFVRFASHVKRDAAAANGDGEITADAVVAALLRAHPNAREATRVANLNPAVVCERYLETPDARTGAKVGEPVVVTDGGRDWTIGMEWGFDGLAKRYGARHVVCNDRAPARRADSREKKTAVEQSAAARANGAVLGSWGGPQRSCALPLEDYLQYARARPGCDDVAALAAADAPFYANGWRAFERSTLAKKTDDAAKIDALSDDAALTTAFPLPYFTSEIDHTRLITLETYKKLLPSASDDAASAVVDSLDASLTKLFVGPCATITRLHQDAGDAHAWLGQAVGRKLFVCFPPDDAAALFPIDGEVETVQSAIDPLAPPEALRKQRRAYFEDARPVVFVVHPGEVVLCPRGWWHYAVALDHSVTVMRNFYNANTNVNALVGTIIAKARKTAVVCG